VIAIEGKTGRRLSDTHEEKGKSMDSTDMPEAASVNRELESGIQTVSLEASGIRELFITADLCTGGLPEVFRAAMDVVERNGATVVSQMVFAPMGEGNSTCAELRQGAGDTDWPLTWIDSGHCAGSPLAGMHIHAVSGADVERITLADRPVASVFRDEHARYCCVGDLWAGNQSVGRTEQAEQTFDMMETVLKLADMDFSNVVRTWLYLDKLLEWYGPFNKVRDGFFRRRGVFDAMVPASTGISGANPSGAAVAAAAFAVERLNDSMNIAALPSPLQCPALKYGSSFSRAVEMVLPGYKRVLVSGTASIEPGGDTAYVDDVPGQIDLTMRVVLAILDLREMAWSDVTRAIAYFKSDDFYQAYKDYCRDNGLPDMPTVITENDICRDDLLFEIELDAIASAN